MNADMPATAAARRGGHPVETIGTACRPDLVWSPSIVRIVLCAIVGILLALPAGAQRQAPGTPIVAPPPLAIGPTDRAVSLNLRVPRPPTKSCIVTLFARREFTGEAPLPLTFTPPAGCAGPWARVVLEASFDGSAGEQYDRSAFIELGGANLYTGTTMEPRVDLAPHWSIERDVTDYAALLRSPVQGTATLVNFVDGRFTGRVWWTARLVFYSADIANPAPRVPDIVVPLTPQGARLSHAAPIVERSIRLPRNVERLVLDLLSMPQAGDEFWYACVPDAAYRPDQHALFGTCGAPFRESEVRIDGALAGLAPVYPWIYTGGMGAWNWTIVPAIGTLDLQPYRIDLTPFAARLNDGKTHRIAISVRGADDYMATNATLLAWQDRRRAVVRGALTENTIAASALKVTGTWDGAEAFGTPIETLATRRGSIAGYLDTSHGRVTTRIDQSMRFANRQRRWSRESDLSQETAVDTVTTTRSRGGVRRVVLKERYPLSRGPAVPIGPSFRRSGAELEQRLIRDETVTDGNGTIRRTTARSVSPRELPSSGGSRARIKVESVLSLRVEDSKVGCYDRSVTVLDRSIASVRDGCDARR